MTIVLAALDRLFGSAERRIALLDRCRPRELAAERSRLVAAWEAGRTPLPRFDTAPCPDLAEVQAGLQQLAEVLGGAGPWGELYAARAHELALEATIVAANGTDLGRAAAAARYPSPVGAVAERARDLAEAWTTEAIPARADREELSDDHRSPTSLVSVLRAAIGRHCLPVRVQVDRNLVSKVAVGDGVVRVRAGIALTAAEVERLVVHELLGHVFPRFRASREALGLFRVATAGGADDEEGRAVALEVGLPGFDARRRRELGLRHLGALALRGGASWVEVVRLLLDRGATRREAVELALRIDRGGALGRELVYLPAFVRFQEARRRGFDPEPWMRRGRIAVRVAPVLAGLGAAPERIRLGGRGAHSASQGRLVRATAG
ncbi:MAG: DUF1704 domain-containing protein [Polyangiaceae bacterium]|nr:DUF1704 domain-containing protein [Polyangiaceae bacterium]